MKAKKSFLGWQRRSATERVLYCIIFVLFAFFALSYLYCLWWCFMSGMKTHDQIVDNAFRLPDKWHFEHLGEMMRLMSVSGTGFWGMLFNSIYFSVIGAFLSASCTAMLAYVTCKYKFLGAGAYFIASLITMILPIYGNGGSMYVLLHNLGLLNSRMQILTCFTGIGVNYMYFHAFFQNMSNTYMEAAQIDGAGDYTIFFRVMLPQALPMFGAIFLMVWMAEWNNYSSAVLYLNKLPTLSAGIYLFQTEATNMARFDILYMAYFVTCIPPLIIFIFFNNVLMSNISLGGIKE